MNFQNFYTLIFKLKAKVFINLFLLTILTILIISLLLKIFVEKTSDNNLIKNYQIEKINSIEFKNINTIFVGDSSGGNAINAQYFDKLSGLSSANLSLTGSWGIIGSLGIIEKAYEKNPSLKNIVIIQTLSIWDRKFPTESIFKLFKMEDFLKYLNIREIFAYYFNPKEIRWNLISLFNTKYNSEKIDLQFDYLLQNKNKYSNGKKEITKDLSLNHLILSESKKNELKELEKFCLDNSINCIFLNGPIHRDLLNNSTKFIEHKNNVIDKQFSYIKYFPNILSYENHEMGDSPDHIDTKIKNNSTLDYYDLIKKHLIY